MYQVTGYRGGLAYRVQVGGDLTAVPTPRKAGICATDPATAAWLLEQAGQPWEATPTGPFGKTDLSDPASVLGTLLSGTDVTEVDGDSPDLIGTAAADVVY